MTHPTEPDPEWEWTDHDSDEPSEEVESAVADALERALPEPTTGDLRDLLDRFGRERLTSLLTGGAASKAKGTSKITGDKGAWTRARKWLSDHLGSQRRKKISEPYRSRIAGLISPPKIIVSMTIHARVSARDKVLYVKDLDVRGRDKDDVLSGIRSRDPGKAIYTILKVWGNGMENRVTRVYGVDQVSIKR